MPVTRSEPGSTQQFDTLLYQLLLFGKGWAPCLHRLESQRQPPTCSVCLYMCVCVQNMCLWLSVCDLQQHTLVAVMSIQVVVVLKSSQSHTDSCTLSLCVWPDTCSPDVGRHSWRSHHTCGQFMSPHTILTLSQSTCRFVEPESSYEETTARLWERNTLTSNSSFSHLKAWKLWLKIGGCVSNKYLSFFNSH